MKKLIIFMLAAVAMALPAAAQNANRSGIFLEVGGGGVLGKSPTYKLSISDGAILQAHNLAGFGFDFATGYRYATSRFCAVEMKINAQLPMQSVDDFILGFMPGFRYTSREFSGNSSFFAAINAGLGLYGVRYNHFTINMPNPETNLEGSSFSPDFNYELSFGINFTNAFYASFFWDGFIIDANRVNLYSKQTCHWGSLGLRLGYLFQTN